MSPVKNGVILLVTSLCLRLYFNLDFRNDKPHSIEGKFNYVQMVQNFGYPIETHKIVSDGYILTLHRIPHGKTPSKNQTSRIPILFSHGFLNSGADFVNLGPDKSLSLLLADKNYDIWLHNLRGNIWSMAHEELDPVKNKEKFWNFSFDETAANDIPAIIDYVLEKTNHTKLHYVGYSCATAQFFAMVSEKPRYVNKIRLMTAMAPSIYINHAECVFHQFLGKYPKFLENVFYYLNIYDFCPHNGYIASMFRIICRKDSIFLNLCIHQLSMFGGYDYEQINTTILERMYYYFPAGAAFRQYNQAIQYMATGRFAKYDYGPEQNIIKYGQIDPPLYNLSKATVPVAVYYAANDWLCDKTDVERFINDLPNIVKKYLVPYENFAHQDFLYAKDADKLVYKSIIEEIEKY